MSKSQAPSPSFFWLEMIITIITGIFAAVWVIRYFHEKEQIEDNGVYSNELL